MDRKTRWTVSVGLGAVVLAGVAAWLFTCAHQERTVKVTAPRADVPIPPVDSGVVAAKPGSAIDPPAPNDAEQRAQPSAPPEKEDALMARLRGEVDPRPAVALELIRRAEKRYPVSRRADERSLLKIRALVHQNRIAAARDEAVRFFRRFPNSRFAGRVHQLTGVHPRPRPGPRGR